MVKVKELTITATIPTAQYANIQPSIKVEVDGDIKEAKEEAMRHIVQFSKEYGEEGKSLDKRAMVEDKLVEVRSDLTPGIAFLDSHHHYWDKNGQPYLSASRFAKKFEKEFPRDAILSKMVGAYGGTLEEHQDLWSINSDVSTQFGKAVHAALELYGKYKELGAKTGAKEGINKALAKQPYLQSVVLDFFKDKEGEDALYEQLMLDEAGRHLAIADRIKFVNREKKIVRVQDFKTNADVRKKITLLAPFDTLPKEELSKYWLQLSYEAAILKKSGYTVEGLDVFHLTEDGWVTISNEVIDLNEVM